MSEKIQLTPELYEKYQKELEHLINVAIPKNSEDIANAKAQGDLSENAEYEYAKEEQFRLEKERVRIKALLNNAVIKERNQNTDFVDIGHKVTFESLDNGEVETVTLVGQWDEQLDSVPADAPFGKSLFGKAVGDAFVVDTPKKGELRYKVLEIK